jgi:hypothetical protein
MLKVYIRILVIAACILSSWSICADQIADLYQVEIIFFENTDPRRFDSEHWPKFVGKLDSRKAIRLNSLKGGIPDSIETLDTLDALDEAGQEPVKQLIPQTIYKVDPNKMLLSEEVRMVKQGKSQRFIQHLAWSQPLALNVRSTPVYFQAGKNQKEIEGVVDVKPVRNYFSLNLDFIFRSGDKEFRVTKELKMKKREVFFVDHPVMGALIVVSPILAETGTSNQP